MPKYWVILIHILSVSSRRCLLKSSHSSIDKWITTRMDIFPGIIPGKWAWVLDQKQIEYEIYMCVIIRVCLRNTLRHMILTLGSLRVQATGLCPTKPEWPKQKSGCREIIGRRRQDCRNEIGSICNVFFCFPSCWLEDLIEQPPCVQSLLNALRLKSITPRPLSASHPMLQRSHQPRLVAAEILVWYGLVISPVCSFCWSGFTQHTSVTKIGLQMA